MDCEIETILDVVCSCGKTTALRIPKNGVCRADDPAWQFHAHPDPEHDHLSRLWHCGADGHYQAGLQDHVPARAAGGEG